MCVHSNSNVQELFDIIMTYSKENQLENPFQMVPLYIDFSKWTLVDYSLTYARLAIWSIASVYATI